MGFTYIGLMENVGYRIEIDNVDGVGTALHNNRPLATSTDVRVLRETRLPDCYYFPKSSIDKKLLTPSDKRTFCPFKGTASYWHVVTPSGMVKDGAWSYETPLAEATNVGGYLAFTDDAAGSYSFTPLVRPSTVSESHISSALSDWILREAGNFETRRELVGAMGRKFVESGIEVYRLNVIIWSLHPEVAGASYFWFRDTDTVTVSEPSHDLFADPRYLDSPVRHVTQGLGGVRQPLELELLEFDYPIVRDLKTEGATDYVAMPIRFSNGQFNVMTMASDKPGGFSTSSLGLIFECSGTISRYLEVLTLRRNTETLLDTYLGRRTGQRVLRGEIRRGQGDVIRAVILFSDLRNSTRLAEELSRSEYLQLLNHYYDTVLEPVEKNGGEVLKFIGDAVLAVFPISADEGDQDIQARAAYAAACEAASRIRQVQQSEQVDGQPALNLGIALHIGDVTYGNVGGHNRLDFTVIGPAVNLASRIESLCKTSGNTILMSADFAALINSDPANRDIELRSIGHHTFSGIADTQEIYASVERQPDLAVQEQ